MGALWILSVGAPMAQADTWVPGAGGSWATGTNWDTTVAPNAPGVSVIFNTPTAARTVTNDGGASGFTVGAITFNNDGGFNNSLTTGTAGSNLKLNNSGNGVTITANGIGTGNNTISVPLILNDSVTAIVNSTSASSAAGNLNLTATISGTGSFTKQGLGLMTFGTGTKTYTGATTFDTNSGRTRISVLASPTATSSVTVRAGSQLTLIAAGTYSWGSGPLNLSGTGPTAGPHAGFPGVIRNDTDLVATITNPVVLQSDCLIHVQGATTGSTTFTNGISGPGGLTVTAPGSNFDIGVLALGGAGTYTGATMVNAGTLKLQSISGAALGSTNAITIKTQTGTGGTFGNLLLAANEQINDLAPMTLNGGRFSTGGFSEHLGALTTSAGSIIDLGNLSSIINFANSSAQLWSGPLSIYNWNGNPGAGGGTDQLFFGSNALGLNAAQLSQITFYSDAGFTIAGSGPAQILSTGEVVPIPEPAAARTLLGGLGALLACRRPRRNAAM
jgi:autotransporter-associated beta strand protein